MHTVDHYCCTEEQRPEFDRVKFCLMNHEYILTLAQWAQCFRFTNNTSDVHITTFILNHAPWEYFNLMTIRGNTCKGNQVDHPSIRYLFYVIANTLQARGEFTRV